jgi:hypothetical protein
LFSKATVLLVICVAILVLLTFKAEDGDLTYDYNSDSLKANNAEDPETTSVADIEELETVSSELRRKSTNLSRSCLR